MSNMEGSLPSTSNVDTESIWYTCDRCDYKTTDKSNFKKHISKKIPCPEIKSNISMEEMLNKFLSERDLERSKGSYHCQYCNLTYTSKSGLEYHLKVHHQDDYQEKLKDMQMQMQIIQKEMADLSSAHKEIAMNIKEANVPLECYKQEISKLKKELQDSRDVIEMLNIQIGFLKNQKNEDFYQKIVEMHLQGTHKRLTIGVTDVTNDTIHAEIKKWDDFKNAIGQLVAYNIEDPKERLQIYFFGKYGKTNKENAANCVKKANMEVYTFRFPTPDEIEIIEYFSEECVFSYKI